MGRSFASGRWSWQLCNTCTGLMSDASNSPRPAAPGLDAVNAACRAIYPDQPNPLQVTAVVKHWLGGPDPLDYISMFSHPGKEGVPPHWHYVSLGLSDLHGDGRVHDLSGPGLPSGFGFELTFRLKQEPGESSPPTWPAELMQGLARYVFHSENALCAGDHISWHSPLDQGDSRLQHMLLTEDPLLSPLDTPLGCVKFVQIVGVVSEELDAAQKWNGPGMLDLLRKHPGTGGPWLVTDMRRGESLFELDLTAQSRVDEGIHLDGSNLSGVSAVCTWEDRDCQSPSSDTTPTTLTMEVADPTSGELLRTASLEQVQLKFNVEAARLLPLAIRGRLKHGRHFTFKSFAGDVAITFVCAGVQGAFADERHLYAAHGPWLQVFLRPEFFDLFLADVESFLNAKKLCLPHTLEWPAQGLVITILPSD